MKPKTREEYLAKQIRRDTIYRRKIMKTKTKYPVFVSLGDTWKLNMTRKNDK